MQRIFYILFFLIGGAIEVNAQLTVNSNFTNVNLVQDYLLGPGVCAKNIRWNGVQSQRARYVCAGGCNVGFSSGVLITSGSAINAIGPNNSGSQTTAVGGPADPQLTALVPGSTGFDAGSIEFDFSVPSDSVSFRFVFASEEYNDFVNTSCNDVFGFFISGPGYPVPTNIARIPGTSTAIAINNVNNGQSGTGTLPTGPCVNCAYYRDNTGGTTVEYDGMTVVMTASALVRPCTMYHFKMAVQDNCDASYDSGVFFEANSFQATGEIPLVIDGDTVSNNDTILICAGDTIQASLPDGPNYLWSTGATTKNIVITQPGLYYGTLSDTCCFAFSIVLNVVSQVMAASITPQGPTSFCNGDSVTLTAVPIASNLSYLWSNGATTTSITVQNSGNYSVTISNGGNCAAISPTVQIIVNNNPLSVITPSGPLSFCNGNTVTLSSANTASSYLWSSGQTTSTISVNNGGAYTLTLTSAGCSSNSVVNVIVNNPTTVAITTPGLACTGSPTLLNATAGIQNYQWSTGQTTAQISVSIAGNYSVTATNSNGCTSTNTYAFVPLPFTAPMIVAPTGFCSGSNATLTASAGYNTYAWSNGTATAANTVNSSGIYTVTVTAANGCTGITAATITTWPLPASTITGVSAICAGTTATYTAGPLGLSYLWSTGVTTQAINSGSAGFYTVTVTDINNCSASATQQLTINPSPVIVFTGILSVCQGNAGLIDAGSGFSSYLWSDGSTLSSISPSVAGNYTVTVTQNGCSSTLSAPFTVNALPTPAISGSPGFCLGSTTTLQVTLGYLSYLWTDGSTASSITTGLTGTYTATVSDINGCTNVIGLTVAAYPQPLPILPSNVSICTGSNYSLQPGNFQSYLWSDNSVASSLIVNSSGNYAVTVTDANGCSETTASTVAVQPLPQPIIVGPSYVCSGQLATFSAGTFSSFLWSNGTSGSQLSVISAGTYSVTVTDGNGCTNSTSTSLIVHPLPLVQITGLQDFCEGGSVNINTLSGQGTYLWSNGNTTASINVNATGLYTVTATSMNGCLNSNAYQVNERPDPVVDFSITQSPACNEILVKFNNLTIAELGTNYLWQFGDSSSSIKAAPQHSYYLPNDYTVYLFATSPYGCQGKDSLTFTVDFPPSPIARFTFTPDIVSIYNSKIRFINTSTNAVRYKWNFGDGQTSDEENPSHYFDRIGEQIITLFAFNSESCYDEIQMPLEVVPFWIPNAFTPNKDGKNDRFFEAGYVMDISSFDMQIFNRWGMLVFTSNSIEKSWDGSYAGKDAGEDLYSYIIKVTSNQGKTMEFKGTFSLLR